MGIVAGHAIEPATAFGDATAVRQRGRVEPDEPRVRGRNVAVGPVAFAAERHPFAGVASFGRATAGDGNPASIALTWFSPGP